MKRFSVILFALLLIFGLVASVVVAQHAAPVSLDSPNDCGDCLPTSTPAPHSATNPGDPDGDGVPNGIDQCPDQGGPSSNSGCPPGTSAASGTGATSDTGAAPVPPPAVVLPTMPFTGGCVLATRSDQAVNVRAEPSTQAAIVGELDPQTLYPVIAVLNNAEGVWDRIALGWVARRVVRLGGNCDLVPMVDETGANGARSSLSHPDDFKLALDKGNTPGDDTPQGYCSPAFGVDASSADGSVDKLNFAFGSVGWCIKLNSDGQGFVLSPSDPCVPAQGALTCSNIKWYVGFSPDNVTPIIVALLQPTPGESDPPDPDKPGVMLVWRFATTPSQGGAHAFALNFALGNPPDPDKPGVAINWSLGNPPEPDFQGVRVNFTPAAQNTSYAKISWFQGSDSMDDDDDEGGGAGPDGDYHGPPDPDDPNGMSINAVPVDPSDPEYQGFGIGDAAGAHAIIVVQFPLPAVP